MTRILMHLLPYSMKLGYGLSYKCLYFIRNVSRKSSYVTTINYLNSTTPLSVTDIISRPIYNHTKSKCNRVHDGDIGESEEGLFSVSKNIESEEHSEQFRNTLFPESQDPIIVQLKTCPSIQQLSTILEDNLPNLSSDHYCQCILVLWDLVKCLASIKSHSFSFEEYKLNDHISFGNKVILSNSDEIRNIILSALKSIAQDSSRLSQEAIVCAVLYSNRLGISLKNPQIQTLLAQINQELLRIEESFPLSALSRLTIALEGTDELWAKLFLIKTIPHIYGHFDNCRNADDFRALTISMLSTVQFFREDFLLQYEGLTEEMLRAGVVTRAHSSVIVKAVLLLSHIYYRPAARLRVYQLLGMLSGQVGHLFLPHLLDLQKVSWFNMEPHFTITELETVRGRLNLLSDPRVGPQFLFLIKVPLGSKGNELLKDVIRRASSLEQLMFLTHHVTTAYPEACYMLWLKVAELFDQADSSTFSRICNRYLTFSWRMARYKHDELESAMVARVARDWTSAGGALPTHDLVLFAAVVLALDHGRLAAEACARLLPIVPNLSAGACLLLSRGLMQGLLHRHHTELSALLELDTAVNNRVKELLEKSENISIAAFNMLLRSSISRKTSLKSDLVEEVIKRCNSLDWTELTSRSMRQLIHNLYKLDALVPSTVDQLVGYCLKNRMYITGNTVGKVSFLCYWLGHSPTDAESFFTVAGDLITRDYSQVAGLSLLQAALALSFFNRLPAELNRLIFSVKFLERLDDEIKNCFAKDQYPVRVRHTMMQLNRSVCLDQPEADVPWFHSKYCEEQLALGLQEGQPRSLMFADVQTCVAGLAGAGCVQSSAPTPYGYTVDFQINLDSDLRPVPVKETKDVLHRLALVLQYADSFTTGEVQLKGYHQLKQRHLEILGYKVVNVSHGIWNAMCMAEPQAKLDYLKNIIWPQQSISWQNVQGKLSHLKQSKISYGKHSEQSSLFHKNLWGEFAYHERSEQPFNTFKLEKI